MEGRHRHVQNNNVILQINLWLLKEYLEFTFDT